MDKWGIYYSNILIDNITETYEIQFPIKKQVEPNRLCYGSDLRTHEKNPLLTPKMAKLAEAKLYADGLITQIVNGSPEDTLKELNDKILAIQSIIGGSNPDADSIVIVAELLAVFPHSRRS
jgi:hypothetical protein